MPSFIIANASGGDRIISGNPWSGTVGGPAGGVQLLLDAAANANAYVTFSGGCTVLSGGFPLSGGGQMDGMKLTPGQPYFVPKTAFKLSGVYNLFVACDPATSGQGRLFWDGF